MHLLLSGAMLWPCGLFVDGKIIVDFHCSVLGIPSVGGAVDRALASPDTPYSIVNRTNCYFLLFCVVNLLSKGAKKKQRHRAVIDDAAYFVFTLGVIAAGYMEFFYGSNISRKFCVHHETTLKNV